MAKNGFKVFDSDMHIMEPPDLWERYIDPEFRSTSAARPDFRERARSRHDLSEGAGRYPTHRRHAASRPQL